MTIVSPPYELPRGRGYGERINDLRVNVKDFGAIGDGVADDTAAIAQAIAEIVRWGLGGYIGHLYFPRGTYLTGAINHSYHSLRMIGDGRGSVIQHKDGEALPLIRMTGAATAGAAAPYGGYSGLMLKAGSLTTYIIYHDGNIDNNYCFDDLSFAGSASNTTMLAAVSVQDYLNWNIRRCRWDTINGWGIEVRDASKFFTGYLSMRDFTYDATVGYANRAKGLLKIDNSALSNIHKGPVVLDGFRIEINSALVSESGQASIFRFLLNSTYMDAGAPSTIELVLRNGSIEVAPVAKDLRVIGWNVRDLAWSADGLAVYGPAVMAQNDSLDALQSVPSIGTSSITQYDQFAVGHGRFNTNGRRSRGGRRFIRNATGYLWSEWGQRADIWWNDRPGLSGVGRYAAVVQAQDDDGAMTNGDTASNLCTGSINATSTTLTFTSPNSRFVPGVRIAIPGAGAAAATLYAKVQSVDYAAGTAVLDAAASTTVAGVVCTSQNAQLAWVPLVFRSNVVPASGTYLQGDRAVADNVSSTQPVAEWVCTVAGSPGTWRATTWITSKAATGSRPTLTTSDVGVTFLDTTLDVDGKPIWWTGTAWVDATGATV